ncbi:hypothetical protein [Vibrio vulnificus]|uniref:hypothetical protein n=1 Tax=Vibrio vulnificus TaxID=672 RepID=UPI0012AE102E|nr:hypothetical protein [Vibrio vulnificus]
MTEDASITGSISAEDVDLPAGASLTFSTTSTAAGLTLNADVLTASMRRLTTA